MQHSAVDPWCVSQPKIFFNTYGFFFCYLSWILEDSLTYYWLTEGLLVQGYYLQGVLEHLLGFRGATPGPKRQKTIMLRS